LRFRRILGGLLVLLFLLGARDVRADSGASAPPFSDVIAKAKLVVLATVTQRPDGGYTLDVERVLKGESGPQLVFAPSAVTVPLEGWKRAVVAFADPGSLDSRAPTIAWHVAPDGTIDPEGYQRYPGLPPTLDALLQMFGPSSTETAGQSPAVAEPAPSTTSSSFPVVTVVAILVGAAALVAVAYRVRRSADPG